MNGASRVAAATLLVAVAAPLVLVADAISATSPFGVGLPEPTAAPGGWLGGFFGWVAAQQSAFYRSLTAAQQSAFYRSLTAAVRALKEDGSALWLLAGLSFAYGVFHAAGPGHGKAVITSYALASGETVRRAVALSFASALAQGVTAVAMVGVAAVLLNMTSIAITETTRAFEIGSYALIVGLGAWLLWRKAARPLLRRRRSAAMSPQPHAHSHDHADCCGHAHAPDPTMLRDRLTFARAGSIVFAVGLRPCTGALIVLIFALSQGLLLAGVVSTFVMALGTGLTVAVLASLALGARGLALRVVDGESRLAARLHRGVEIAGALAVFLIGLTLLTAAIGWG